MVTTKEDLMARKVVLESELKQLESYYHSTKGQILIELNTINEQIN